MHDAINVLNNESLRIVLVVDESEKLIGTVTDGDIRRGLLRKKLLSKTIEDVYFKSPITANKGGSKEELLHICSVNGVAQVPIVDKDRKVIGLFIVDDGPLKKQHKNNVVLMVGGLGTRLRPLTENTPKPMLKVGGVPILEIIVNRFVDFGFTNITMCLGYTNFHKSKARS